VAKRWVIVVAEFEGEDVSVISGDYDPEWRIRDGGRVRAWTRDGEGMVPGQIVGITVTDGSLPFVWPES
jgi:hypothetical protein